MAFKSVRIPRRKNVETFQFYLTFRNSKYTLKKRTSDDQVPDLDFEINFGHYISNCKYASVIGQDLYNERIPPVVFTLSSQSTDRGVSIK